MSLYIGDVLLKKGLLLAPMAGVTDTTFRLLCKSKGAEYTVSEMVSAKALCYAQRAKRQSAEGSESASLARVSLEQMPMAVQLFGSEPEFMAEAASMIEKMNYRGCESDCAPAAIDINMGCPMRKITSNSEGSALMKDPILAANIVRAVAAAVSIPVTVKIRSGWDSNSVNAPEFAKRLEEAGAAAICVHARTKEQMYLKGIDLSVIERTKSAVSIPVIGNGDIYSAEDAMRMISSTGCDGVMVGRGAQGNPWIFSEISALLEGKKYEPPSISERFDTAIAQLDRMIELKGARVGTAEAKKHMAWYIVGIRGAARARARIMSAVGAEEIRDVLRQIYKEVENEEN